MFVRAQTRTLKSGRIRQSFALLESRRIDGSPKHITLLNLGKGFALPKEEWKDFTAHVRAHFEGKRPSSSGKSKGFLQTVRQTVSRLKKIGYGGSPPAKCLEDQPQMMLPRKTRHLDSRSVGGERLLLHELNSLGVDHLLEDLGFNPEQIKLAYALILGRILSPGSERHTHTWMCESSSILELLDFSPPGLSSLYRCSDHLYEHRDPIIDHLFGQVKQSLGLEETVVFYDLTNTFYYGKEKGELLRHGRSKEKRSDCRLVSMSLVLDGSGFPRGVEILPGNVSEPATLSSATEKLEGAKPTVIMDAGIATEKNISYLAEKGLPWICVDRRRPPPMPSEAPDVEFENASGAKVKAWVLSREGGEMRIWVYSEFREAVDRKIFEAKRKAFEEALKKLRKGLTKRGGTKKYDKVLRKLGRLIEKHQGVSHLYDVQVIQQEGDETLAGDIQVTKLPSHEAKLRSVGGYVLRTSHCEWEPEQIVRTYWRLAEIEQVFRSMKSDLGLRPIYHSKDERIEGHLFISVLAYLVSHLVRTKLKKHEVQDSWKTLREKLNDIRRTTTRYDQTAFRYLLTRMDQNLSPFLEEVFQILNVDYDVVATMTLEMVCLPPPEPEEPPPEP